jgi:hypothetical protein
MIVQMKAMAIRGWIARPKSSSAPGSLVQGCQEHTTPCTNHSTGESKR